MGKNKQIAKRSVLGGKVELKGEKRYKGKDKTDLVKIVHPITKKTTELSIYRGGKNDKKLIELFSDPKATRRQKDSFIAGYLFEAGKENASFVMDLMMSKGTAMRDQQAFKAQMRFDYELITDALAWLLHDLSNDIEETLREGKDPYEILAIIAQRMRKGSDLIIEKAKKVTLDRMREKGFGIYLAIDGIPYDVYSDTEEIAKVVSDDVTRVKEEKDGPKKEVEEEQAEPQEREDC